MRRIDLDELPQTGFWVFLHPRELYLLKYGAQDSKGNRGCIKPFAEQFYRVLREHMQGGTRLVINCPWEYLRTCMETVGIAGSHEEFGRPTLNKLRETAKYLEKVGLLKFESVKRALIFDLYQAPTQKETEIYLKSVKKILKNSQNPPPGAATEEQQMGATDTFAPRRSNKHKGLGHYKKQRNSTGEIERNNSLSSISSLPPDNNINKHNSLPQDNSDFFGKNIHFDYTNEEFKIFWAEYPNGRYKAEAYRIWIQNNLSREFGVIMQDIALRKLQDRQWKQGYVINAARYLEVRFWDDEDKTGGPEIKKNTERNKNFYEENMDKMLAKAAKFDREIEEGKWPKRK